MEFHFSKASYKVEYMETTREDGRGKNYIFDHIKFVY